MQTRRFVPLVVAAIASALPAFAQTNFQYQSYATPNGANVALNAENAHVADFNNDGLADVLTTSDYTCSGGKCTQAATLDLYINNGNGGLNAPVQLPVTLSGGSFATEAKEVAVADFNGDGKLDIAAIGSSGGIAILYGNGDGTFKAPVYIAVQSNDAYTALVTADFDVNGTPDLGLLTQDGVLWLLYNDGKGNFTQQGVPIDSQPAGFTTTSLVVGDFNNDGRPDIAWVEQSSDQSAENTVWSALNTAKGEFSTKHEVGTLPIGFGNLLSADLDLDGKSDLVTWTTQLVEECCSELPVTAYYSSGSGTFTSSMLASAITDDVGVTDINGDGNPDVLIAGNEGVTVLTGNGNRTFTDQGTYSSLPGGAMQLGFGFFSATDAMGFAAPNGGANAGGYPNDMYLVANDNAQGDCAYPASAGVRFCEAVQNGNSALVRGTARAQTQPVRLVELWANGKKLYQVWSDEFNATLDVAPGTAITAVEVEANGATKSTTVTPTAATTCDAPGSPGVNVCSPTAGEDVASPVTFRAAGTGASGTVNHLELWIDGTKIGNYTGSMMDASVAEAVGSHTATVIEVDSKGDYVKSTPVTYTVGGTSGGGCAAPSSPGVDVCSPTSGETVTSPVTFEATGKGASGTVNHLELWIDGTKIGNYTGATMDASVTEAAGSHTATVVEVDSKGDYVKSTPVTYTVGSGSSAAVAYVYSANEATNNPSQPQSTVEVQSAQANGNETLEQGVDTPTFATAGLAVNSSYLFVPAAANTSAIYAYKVGSNGTLTEGATTDTSAEGYQGAAFFDRNGQTLYSWMETSDLPKIVSWSTGTNGALTMINSVSVNTSEPANPQVTFLPNDQTAYWTDCPGRSSAAFEGFTRAANGALTEFNPNMNFPAAPSGTSYCPLGAAAADNTHVVVALMDLQNSNFGFEDTQLAVYTVGANGSLTTTNTSADMPELGALPIMYAFDPTGTWLALGDSSGLDLYKYSNGVLTHTDSVALSSGVLQVSWDASGHVYAVGQACCGGTAVYSVSSAGQLTPAPDNGTWGDGLGGGVLQAVLPVA